MTVRAQIGRRDVLQLSLGLLATSLITRPREVFADQICSGPRSCLWPSAPSPAVDLQTLGWLLVSQLNPYNKDGTVQQLDYWDDQIEWMKRSPAPWAFKNRIIGVDRALRVPYVGAKDREIGILNDEHILIGLAVDDDAVALPASGITKFTIDPTSKPSPTPIMLVMQGFKTLGWLALVTCSPATITTEWYTRNDFYDTTTIPEDKDGAAWPFRGHPVRVENSRRVGPFFLKVSGKFYRAQMLVGYEGSGGY